MNFIPSQKPSDFPFSQRAWQESENVNYLAKLNSDIQDWLLGQNLTCCIIKLNGKPYKLDALFGLSAPPEDISELPQLECPFSAQLEAINYLS